MIKLKIKDEATRLVPEESIALIKPWGYGSKVVILEDLQGLFEALPVTHIVRNAPWSIMQDINQNLFERVSKFTYIRKVSILDYDLNFIYTDLGVLVKGKYNAPFQDNFGWGVLNGMLN